MTTANTETHTGTLITDLLATAEKYTAPTGAILSRPEGEDEMEYRRR